MGTVKTKAPICCETLKPICGGHCYSEKKRLEVKTVSVSFKMLFQTKKLQVLPPPNTNITILQKLKNKRKCSKEKFPVQHICSSQLTDKIAREIKRTFNKVSNLRCRAVHIVDRR